ncbi:protein of unknown function [Pseudomonas sp. JV551A1]|uniref:Uncharacterized protein n=1 Tax=Pseudomonas inefficax TaxID=2078786 RepID=A0AAQ1SRF5_9PSED|nr:protein of unknown function [Pseudomonas sp. JV551A1]SPO58747.1 protein of unknown function [Pseudomonas inefficax]
MPGPLCGPFATQGRSHSGSAGLQKEDRFSRAKINDIRLLSRHLMLLPLRRFACTPPIRRI